MSRRRNPEAEAAVIAALAMDAELATSTLLDEISVNPLCCPKCECKAFYIIKRDKRPTRRCKDCSHEWSNLSQTPFRANKKEPQFYLATMRGVLAEPPISAHRLSQLTGMEYGAVWRLQNKILEWRAINSTPQPRPAGQEDR